MIPWFVVGFGLFSALRTIGDASDPAFGIFSAAGWNGAVAFLRQSAETCLLIAMAAVGLSTRFAGIRSIGLRPFLLGLFAAASVGGVSFLLIALLAPQLIRLIGA